MKNECKVKWVTKSGYSEEFIIDGDLWVKDATGKKISLVLAEGDQIVVTKDNL